MFSSLLRLLPSNYYMYSNLGGWVVQMSQLHQSWQEGREYISPEMVEKFNQLNAMGFGFDIFPTRRGDYRVPHHYKADFR